MLLRFCLIFGLHSIGVSAETIPKQLHLERCNFKDSNFQECLLHAIKDAFPKIRNGVPSIGIPPLDPIEILEMSLQQGQDKGALSLNLKFKNMKLEGVTETLTLSDFKFDKNTLTLSSKALNAGPIAVKGKYQAKGRLLAVPVDGGGDFKFDLYNVSTSVAMYFKEVVRKGTKYWDLVKLDYDINDIGKTIVKLDNLIRGNKALDSSLNQSINENSKELEPSIRPAFSKAIRLFFTEAMQRFFKKLPLEEIMDGVK